MSRYYDISQFAVLFSDTMLPMEAFTTNRDTQEMRLANRIFDFAQDLAEMQLSEVALSLYSAYILLQDGNLDHAFSQKSTKYFWHSFVSRLQIDPA